MITTTFFFSKTFKNQLNIVPGQTEMRKEKIINKYNFVIIIHLSKTYKRYKRLKEINLFIIFGKSKKQAKYLINFKDNGLCEIFDLLRMQFLII